MLRGGNHLQESEVVRNAAWLFTTEGPKQQRPGCDFPVPFCAVLCSWWQVQKCGRRLFLHVRGCPILSSAIKSENQDVKPQRCTTSWFPALLLSMHELCCGKGSVYWCGGAETCIPKPKGLSDFARQQITELE